MARWQRDQLDSLVNNLPQGHVERKQEETQCEYFDIHKVSLHVSILCRHSVEAVDGVSSSEEKLDTIKEHIFIISDDLIQDHNSVHKVQLLIHGYLQNDLGYQVEKLHEFNDGCAGQFKSRHCRRSIVFSC